MISIRKRALKPASPQNHRNNSKNSKNDTSSSQICQAPWLAWVPCKAPGCNLDDYSSYFLTEINGFFNEYVL